jgi:perosamine synthetase
MSELAIHGGNPVRTKLLPYGRQCLDEEDIRNVVEVLRSNWLTTGPKIQEFERAFAHVAGTREAVAVCNGTAALHAAMHALNIGPNDEVIVPAITFASSANAVIYQGGTPIFADVDADSLLLDPDSVISKVGPRSRAVVAVDYAGQPCSYDLLRDIARRFNLALVADACHALGAALGEKPVGSLADLSTFSLHPVKHITSGEGGVITTDNPALAERMRIFRNHGITLDHRQREAIGSYAYEMTDLGHNYRLTDFQCALAMSQLQKLPGFLRRRQEIAARYDAAFAGNECLRPLRTRADAFHAYHLYVILLELSRLSVNRDAIFGALRAEGIGVNVHYKPVYLHPYYQKRFDTRPGACPVAEKSFESMITLPLFPEMTSEDINDVVTAVEKVLGYYRR